MTECWLNYWWVVVRCRSVIPIPHLGSKAARQNNQLQHLNRGVHSGEGINYSFYSLLRY